MSETHTALCNFCDSACGLLVEVQGKKILSIRGDKDDARSRGHICPKGPAQKDLYEDKDRLRFPVKRIGEKWKRISWGEAFSEIGRRVHETQRAHGNDALGFYYGNPVAHDLSTLLSLMGLIKVLKTRNVYSANSVDSLPRLFISKFLYGNQALLPVPDIERTDYFLVLGANPVISNGSIMTAPDCKNRLLEMRARGCKMVVIDPRRTETADIADEHYFIVPSTDAAFLFSLLHIYLVEGKHLTRRFKKSIRGLDEVRRMASTFAPSRAAEITGIPEKNIRQIAREFASASSAVCYGRTGTSIQPFGTLSTWLIDILNIVTGNFNVHGGAMFASPAVDIAAFAKFVNETGKFNRWKSRVNGLPEFNGELPSAALIDEMEKPGKGQLKSLLVIAANMVLTIPDGRRLERAMKKLDFIACVDYYINETTRHAHIILPPVSPLERDHYPVLELAMGIRNTARYAKAVFEKPEGALCDWEILLRLAEHINAERGAFSSWVNPALKLAENKFIPDTVLDVLLRTGPQKLTLKKLKAATHGMDMGALTPRKDRDLDFTSKNFEFVPEPLKEEVKRFEAWAENGKAAKKNELILISRRTMRVMNSWLHNVPHLVKGKEQCVLMMHPDDAQKRGIAQGQKVLIATRAGSIRVTAQLTDEMMRGVVSLPFGWGHNRKGVNMSVAKKCPGASMNDVVSHTLYDAVCGVSVLNGIPVEVSV